MTPVPILSGIPLPQETVLAGQLLPRASANLAASAVDQFMVGISVTMDQVAKPVAGDKRNQSDWDQPPVPFLDLFQETPAQFQQISIPRAEPIGQPEHPTTAIVVKTPVEIEMGIPFYAPPETSVGLSAGSESSRLLAAGADTGAKAKMPLAGVPIPVQVSAPVVQPQSGATVLRPPDIPDGPQSLAGIAPVVAVPVNAAVSPVGETVPNPIGPAPAVPFSDATSQVPNSIPAIKPTPTRGIVEPVRSVPEKPVAPSWSPDAVQPKNPQEMPRDTRPIPERGSTDLGDVKEVFKGAPRQPESPQPVLGGRLAMPPIMTDNPAGPLPPAFTVEDRAPSMPFANDQSSRQAVTPAPVLRDVDLNQEPPTKLQPPVSGLVAEQALPALPALAAVPNLARPQQRVFETPAEQIAPFTVTENSGAPVVPTPKFPPVQPLVAEPLIEANAEPAQPDLSVPLPLKPDTLPISSPAQLSQAAPKSIAIQIAQAAVSDGGQAIEIALDPVELGKVRLTLHTSEAGINVQILADRPETIDLMRRNAHLLEAEFESLGYQNIGFDFSQNQQSTTPENPEGKPDHSGSHGMQIENIPAVHANYTTAPRSGGGLDLRL